MTHKLAIREQEALRYWNVMQGGIANASLAEYRDELGMLEQHCQSDVLREKCEKNARRFDHLAFFRKATA